MHLMSMLLTLEADKSTGTLYKIDIKVHGCLYWLLLIQLTAIFLCSFFFTFVLILLLQLTFNIMLFSDL